LIDSLRDTEMAARKSPLWLPPRQGQNPDR